LLGKGFGRDCAQKVAVLPSSATTRNTIAAWHGFRAL
jgi:hypothetical protein